MKKIIIFTIAIVLSLSLFGCQKDNTTLSNLDVAKSIADIYSDDDGNVTVELVDGRTFDLGNMKGPKGETGPQGEKGEKGDSGLQGRQGIQGLQGPPGINGKNGTDGKDGVDGKDGTIPSDYIKDIILKERDKLYIIRSDGTEEYFARIQTQGMYKIIRRRHFGDQIDEDYSKSGLGYLWANERDIVEVSYDRYLDEDGVSSSKERASYVLNNVSSDDATLTYINSIEVDFGYCIELYKIESMPAKDIYVDFYYTEYDSDESDMTFTVPDRDSSRQRVEDWANRYSFIEFKVQQTATLSDIDTFAVTDVNGNKLSYGATVHVSNNSDKYTCTYYVEKDHTLNVAVAYGNDNNKSVTLSASFDDGSTFDKWEYSDSYNEFLDISQDGTKLTIRIKDNAEDQTITIKAHTDKKSYEVTLTITGQRFE